MNPSTFRFAFLLSLSLLGGCGTIYVSNVAFTSVEVCSEELASRLHPNSGCLPPTRAENAQNFNFRRFRLQVSTAEAAAILAETPVNNELNHLPSWIGRVFKAQESIAVGASGDSRWIAPRDGNIEFIPLGGAPEKKIATEVLVKTDIKGVVEKQINAGAEIDPKALVDAALALSGVAVPASGALGLGNSLAATLAHVGYQRSSTDAGKGTYYYVSMKPEQLDSLTSGLARCGWRILQNPDSQVQKMAQTAAVLSSDNAAGKPECLGDADSGQIDANIRQLLLKLRTAGDWRPDVQSDALGIVIGVAIIRTEGKSELCTNVDFGLAAKGSDPKEKSSKCDALRKVLDDYGSGVAAPGTVSASPPKLTEPEKATILRALSFGYEKSTLKNLELHPHTSVLALHWLPLKAPLVR